MMMRRLLYNIKLRNKYANKINNINNNKHININNNILSYHTKSEAADVQLDYQVYIWGKYEANKIGSMSIPGTGSSGATKALPQPLSKQMVSMKKVACGRTHLAMISVDGDLYTMGQGKDGKLGHKLAEDKDEPTKIQGFRDEILDVSCGETHTLCVTNNGNVYSWGSPATEYGNQIGIPGLQSVVNRINFMMGGANALGYRVKTHRERPKLVRGELENVKIKSVSGGKNHSLALTDDNDLYVWGLGEYGRLGNGGKDAPTPIRGPLSAKLKQISAGRNFSLALDVSGSIWGWGKNDYGQVADNSAMDMYSMTMYPAEIKVDDLLADEHFVQISAGERHGLALTSKGRVFQWGERMWSEPLAILDEPDSNDPFVGLSAGKSFSLAYTKSGKLYSWGQNRNGELGIGEAGGVQQTPTQVESLNNVIYASAGSTFAAAIVDTTR